jgi:signal transduction histidine kinase
MKSKAAAAGVNGRVLAILVLVLAVSLLHYQTRTTLPLLHDLYRRLYYIPVGLAAVWFGSRGGLKVSFLVAALYLPHIMMDWHHVGRELANQLMEIALYFVFSGLIGHYADQERKFRQSWQETAEKLDRSYRELRKQADQILEIEGQLRRADRLSAIGQLSASLTHEIRNPLGSIKGTAEILKDDFPPGHPKAEFLEILLRETDRLDKVVEDFLGFARSRPESEGRELLDLGETARQTALLVEPQARKSSVSFRLEIDSDLVVSGSPVQIKQVLLNLVLNALQVSPPGSAVTIRGRKKTGKVKGLEYREVEGYLAEIAIEDEGPGIPAELLPKIFEPFFTTKFEGTGLGLAISLRIAEAHGGTLDAENRGEGGARFILTLPLAEEGEGTDG